ncbi:hypothetical protein ElyMa_000389400 [Elysia marginata]|uniref:PID domain-containing protein n=1 Tax=Elysia marginata TaxID=1093978 RepID=A0AAV4FHH7_9GAST|nr:hypothetical protein ElyMa_000389400 [Elysia marginata]
MTTTSVLSKKASLLGTWHEDVFTDELLKKIATYATVEKGKNAKVKLSGAGLRICRSRFLQADTSQFYAFHTLKTVTRNPAAPRCVMFILADTRRKYQIIAVRCQTEEDAYDLVNFTARIKKEEQVSNVEFKKRDNGNWTLRERSAHNANRHMAELFNQHTNGTDETTGTTVSTSPRPQNGDVKNHVPVIDASRNRGSYVKRQHSSSTKKSVKEYEKNGEYIVETEVETGEQSENGNANTVDQADGKQTQEGTASAYSNYIRAGTAQDILPSRPQVQTTVTSSKQQPQTVVYRAAPKTYEAKVALPTVAYFPDPWGPHRRVSGSFTVSHKSRGRTDSFQGSNKVTFDTESISSNFSRKSRSMRSIPTTIERSIEDTYARPAVMRRYGSIQFVGARPRPVSYHVMRTNELQVFNAKGRNFDDVAL